MSCLDLSNAVRAEPPPDFRRAVVTAIASMAPQEQDWAARNLCDGETQADIAASAEVSQPYVAKVIGRAKRRLKAAGVDLAHLKMVAKARKGKSADGVYGLLPPDRVAGLVDDGKEGGVRRGYWSDFRTDRRARWLSSPV